MTQLYGYSIQVHSIACALMHPTQLLPRVADHLRHRKSRPIVLSRGDGRVVGKRHGNSSSPRSFVAPPTAPTAQYPPTDSLFLPGRRRSLRFQFRDAPRVCAELHRSMPWYARGQLISSGLRLALAVRQVSRWFFFSCAQGFGTQNIARFMVTHRCVPFPSK